jgi:hypothetical protein
VKTEIAHRSLKCTKDKCDLHHECIISVFYGMGGLVGSVVVENPHNPVITFKRVGKSIKAYCEDYEVK